MTIETKIATNNTNVDTANNLPTGNITVKSGTEAWAIVGKHFPKDNLEFYRAGKGFNNEDTFCYTLDEIIYVHVTCTPDNKRVKCIEIVNTYEESESERNILTVYINHDAEVNTASDDDELIDPPAITPADDFATKLAELKAKQDAAKEKELAAEKVYKEACDKYVECQEATQNFLDAHAHNLTEKISALEIESRITMVRDNGKERYDVFSTNQLNVDAFNGFGEMFIVRYQGNVLGTYDTPAQIEVVINQLKAAVERGDREFKFPTVDELNKPEIDKDATADSLTRAMKIALEKYQDFCRVGNLTAATNEWSLYNICRKAISELLKEEVA